MKLWTRFIFPGKQLRQIHKIEGHLGLKEGYLLFKIAKSLKDNAVIVEIGAFMGKSTCFIAEGIRAKYCEFFTIDTWYSDAMKPANKDVFPEFLENIKLYQHKVQPIRGYSYEVVKNWPQQKKIDFLWIDGDHSYEGVKRDIQDWLPLLKHKGTVCFHDYRDFPGVIQAVDEAAAEGVIKFIKTLNSIYMAKCQHQVRQQR